MKKVFAVLALLVAFALPRLAAQQSPTLTPISATLFEVDGITNLNSQVTISWANCKVRGVQLLDGKMLVTVINGVFATSLPPCDTLYTISYTSQGSGVAMFWRVSDTQTSQNLVNLLAVDPPGANKSLIYGCGTLAACSPTNNSTTLKEFYGTVALSGGTATITGFSPAFTSSSSYVCTAVDNTAAAAVRVAYTSASSITLTGTTTDTVSYDCKGI